MSDSKKNLVVQSNRLIEAHYKQEYTVQEQRTILWLISEIHKEDHRLAENYEHKVIRISAMKYAEIMNIPVRNVYRDAQKIGNGLRSKSFTIDTGDGWINFGWISSMEYKKGIGIIEALIAPAILPYLIDLKGKYTSFTLENILYLKSSYAIKLYQILVQYKQLGTRTIKINSFVAMLGISNLKSYRVYNAIKKRILEVSKREINEKTDLLIDYTEIKEGRKVVAVKFTIAAKKDGSLLQLPAQEQSNTEKDEINNPSKNALTERVTQEKPPKKKYDINEEGRKLNPLQEKYLEITITNLLESGVKLSAPQELMEEARFSLLNADQFKTVNDFKHKINMISKLVREKKWRKPIGFRNHSKVGKRIKGKHQHREKQQSEKTVEQKNTDIHFDNLNDRQNVAVTKGSKTLQTTEARKKTGFWTKIRDVFGGDSDDA